MRAPFLSRLGPPTPAERIKARIPWLVKLGAKLLLSRIRVPYRLWRRLEVFKLGEMLDPRYALEVYRWHYERVRAFLPPAYTVLELGPGDSLATGFVAPALGASCTLLVDAGAHASTDVEAYRRLLTYLKDQGLRVPGSHECSGGIEEMLRASRTRYLTGGLGSLREEAANCVDFVFSQHVLEHLRRAEFQDTIAELFRLQRPGGTSSHSVDLDDHMALGLNSLRFSPERWESERWASAGFYTNRLRASEVLQGFVNVGYELLDKVEHRWPALPIPRRKLHSAFARFSDDDLKIHGLDLLVRKP